MSHLVTFHVLAEGPATWVLNELKNMFWGDGSQIKTLLTGDPGSEFGGGIYGAMFAALRGPGLALAAAAACIRGMKMFADSQRASGVQIMLDLTVRAIVVIGILGVPVAGGQSLGYTLVQTVLSVSMDISMNIFTTIVSTIGHSSSVGGSVGMGVITGSLIGVSETLISSPAGLLGLLIAGVLILLLIYMIIMLIARFLLTAMVVAMAPLVMGVAVFEPKNRFTEWWVEAFFGAALIPVVLAFCIGLTVALATNAVIGKGGAWGTLFVPIDLIGGIWLTGKMMHKLTWRHFQHGGPIGALSAGFAGAWVGPQLAFEAHAGLQSLGMRNDKGLMGLGFNRATGQQGPMGRFMDGALEAVIRKQAAFSALSSVQDFNAEKRATRAAHAAIQSGTPPDEAHMAEIMSGLLGTSRPAVEASPGGPAAFMDYMASNPVRDPVLGQVSHNPNDYVGGFLHSVYSGGGGPVSPAGGGIPVGGAPVGGAPTGGGVPPARPVAPTFTPPTTISPPAEPAEADLPRGATGGYGFQPRTLPGGGRIFEPEQR